MDRSSSETLSSAASSSDPIPRHKRSAYSKKRSAKAQGYSFPYAPQSVPNPWVAASNAEPLKRIESRFLPYDSHSSSTTYYSSSAFTFLPPVLHAGWPINEDALLQWCTTEGFDRTTYDIDDRPVFDYRSTVASALFYLAQRSGLSSCHNPHLGSSSFETGSDISSNIGMSPYIQSTCNQKSPIIVALVSNYDIEGVKKLGLIKNKIYAFGRLLFREGLLSDVDYDAVPASAASSRSKSHHASFESPKWYLDHKEWQWVPVPKEGLGTCPKSLAVPIDVRLKVKVSLKSKPSSSALRPANRLLDNLDSPISPLD